MKMVLLDYFKDKKHFYFSFAGLEESVAERLFTQKVAAVTEKQVTNWSDAFVALSKAYRYIIFDDLTPISSYKRFQTAFYENMCRDIHSRPLVFLVAEPTDNLTGLADRYDTIQASYFSIPEVMKCFPKLSKYDALGRSAVSGGIPKIMAEYDENLSFEENLKAFLMPSSAFINFMPYLMERYFRKPEIYHFILSAIANGNHKISDIGKYCGFAYNKCDNYVSALVAAGIVRAEKEKSKTGTEKTAYTLTNFYFQLWYKYIYQNRAELAVVNYELTQSIVKSITEKEIHAFHLQKAFAYVNRKLRWDLWASFQIAEKIVYAPKTVKKGSFSYTFDAIYKKGSKAVFVKVFADSLENCKKAEFEKIQKAVATTDITTSELLAVNKSVESMVNSITKLEMILQSKIALFEDCICESEES